MRIYFILHQNKQVTNNLYAKLADVTRSRSLSVWENEPTRIRYRNRMWIKTQTQDHDHFAVKLSGQTSSESPEKLLGGNKNHSLGRVWSLWQLDLGTAKMSRQLLLLVLLHQVKYPTFHFLSIWKSTAPYFFWRIMATENFLLWDQSDILATSEPSGLSDSTSREWPGKRNRVYLRMEFHHSLCSSLGVRADNERKRTGWQELSDACSTTCMTTFEKGLSNTRACLHPQSDQWQMNDLNNSINPCEIANQHGSSSLTSHNHMLFFVVCFTWHVCEAFSEISTTNTHTYTHIHTGRPASICCICKRGSQLWCSGFLAGQLCFPTGVQICTASGAYTQSQAVLVR